MNDLEATLRIMKAFQVESVELPNGMKIKLSPFSHSIASAVPENIDERADQISDIKNRLKKLKDDEEADLMWSAGS